MYEILSWVVGNFNNSKSTFYGLNSKLLMHIHENGTTQFMQDFFHGTYDDDIYIEMENTNGHKNVIPIFRI